MKRLRRSTVQAAWSSSCSRAPAGRAPPKVSAASLASRRRAASVSVHVGDGATRKALQGSRWRGSRWLGSTCRSWRRRGRRPACSPGLNEVVEVARKAADIDALLDIEKLALDAGDERVRQEIRAIYKSPQPGDPGALRRPHAAVAADR